MSEAPAREDRSVETLLTEVAGANNPGKKASGALTPTPRGCWNSTDASFRLGGDREWLVRW